MPQDPTGHVLHLAILQSQKVIATLPNKLHKETNREAGKMKRQRNTAQMKEQNKTPEKELNKMETSNLSDAKFKTLVIRMLSELKGRGDELREKLQQHKKEPVRNKGYTKMNRFTGKQQ